MQTAIGDPMQTVVTPRRLSAGHRFLCAIIAASCLSLLALAASLDPDPSGLGTHQGLGLPPCQWVTVAGIPCVTCGMTTAFSHAVHLNPVDSFVAQPFGFLLAIATGVLFWACIHSALTASRVAPTLLILWQPKVIWIVGAFALASWAYKIWAFRQGFMP